MHNKPWIHLLLALSLLVLASCARDEPVETATPTVPPATSTATPRPTATPTPAPTATPSPTPIPLPAVEAIDQSVGEEGEVVVSRAYAPDDGWLVVYADDGGEPGDVLGVVAVPAGEQQDLTVSVDPYFVTPTLYIILHRDAGESGTFEFPGADEPVDLDGEPVAATVAVDLRVAPPSITVADQTLGRDGQLVVDAVSAPASGWIAIHADDQGQPGDLLGLSPVQAGPNEDLVVGLNWRDVTRRLHAVLYADGGEPGVFQPGADGGDAVVLAAGQPVQASFIVQAPPDVYVISQPIVAAEVLVERAFINEPGWIVVYSNYEGFTDRLLGYAALEAGENLRITVPIDPANSTDLLHILLHEDSGVEGEFEYPSGDPPLRDEEGRPIFFSFETDTGNYVITRDQALDGETVEIPLVVSDLDTWAVIWTDEDGAPGEIIGQTLLARGVHRDVLVAIDPAAATSSLWVVLHHDTGVLGEFEYPGPDEILQREREPIQAPFGIGVGD